MSRARPLAEGRDKLVQLQCSACWQGLTFKSATQLKLCVTEIHCGKAHRLPNPRHSASLWFKKKKKERKKKKKKPLRFIY